MDEPLKDNTLDIELMADVAQDDRKALSVLYDRYSRVVYTLAFRILGNQQQAEEIVQETFWRIWRSRHLFQSQRGEFLPWLIGIARNLCIDELRKRRSRPAPTDEALDTQETLQLPDTSLSPAEEAWDSDERRRVRAGLNELPEEQRQVIELAYFKGLSQREIADQLQIPLGTVKTRARLALKKLRDILESTG